MTTTTTTPTKTTTTTFLLQKHTLTQRHSQRHTYERFRITVVKKKKEKKGEIKCLLTATPTSTCTRISDEEPHIL